MFETNYLYKIKLTMVPLSVLNLHFNSNHTYVNL